MRKTVIGPKIGPHSLSPFFDLVGKMEETEADKKADTESPSASVPSTIPKMSKVSTALDAPPPYSRSSNVSISPAGPTGNELAVLAPTFEPGATEPIMVFTAMTVSNDCKENVLFKVKMNFGKEYCTLKPCFGMLQPGECEEILITLKVLPMPSMMDLEWCFKVYDTVDFVSSEEDCQLKNYARSIWSKIDDSVAHVSKTIIPVRFVGAKPAESESDDVSSIKSPRCKRVAAALRSFPAPPAPPPTPIPLERPKSPNLDQKVRMRSFAKETARTDNINEPSVLEEFIDLKTVNELLCNERDAAIAEERDAAIAEKTIQDLINGVEPDKLSSSLKPSLQEALTGSRPDANNNEKDHIMKEDLEDVKRSVTEIKYMMFLVMGIVALRLFGFL